MLNNKGLNLATQPFVNRRRFYVLTTAGTIVLSLSMAILTATLVHTYRSERGARLALRKERDQIARLEGEQKRLEDALSQPRAAEIMDRTDFLNALIRQKAISWTRIFMDLEKVMPNRVQAASLHPTIMLPGTRMGGKSGPSLVVPSSGPLYVDLQMTVNGETYENLLELVRRLQQSPFYDPTPNSVDQPNAASASSTAAAAAAAAGEKLFKLQLHVSYSQ
jgi:Tfp pilus assembly protein PilN